MQKYKTKKYEGQALAIAMVIVIISSIVATSVYFRSQRDKTIALEERLSAEALEISDLLLDNIIPIDLVEMATAIEAVREEEFTFEQGTKPPLKENKNEQEISKLFTELGILVDIQNLNICNVNSSFNEYQLTVKEVDEETYFEIREGQTWSLPLKNSLLEENCQLTVRLAPKGHSGAGFLTSKAFASDYMESSKFATNYKNYDYEDTNSYCFSENTMNCNSQDEILFDNSWIKYNTNEIDNHLIFDLNETKQTYTLDEIRIRAVGGTVGLQYEISPPNCMENLRMISLRATANCSGIYRGKEILIPETKWHNSIFDYVIFNGEGSL